MNATKTDWTRAPEKNSGERALGEDTLSLQLRSSTSESALCVQIGCESRRGAGSREEARRARGARTQLEIQKVSSGPAAHLHGAQPASNFLSAIAGYHFHMG